METCCFPLKASFSPLLVISFEKKVVLNERRTSVLWWGSEEVTSSSSRFSSSSLPNFLPEKKKIKARGRLFVLFVRDLEDLRSMTQR